MANEKITIMGITEDRNDTPCINFKSFTEEKAFGIRIDEGLAEELKEKDWPIRYPKEADSEGNYRPYIKVLLRYFNPKKQPKVFRVTSKKKTALGENDISILDSDLFSKVDVILEKAWVEKYQRFSIYLDTGFFTIDENELMALYADVPEDNDVPFGDEDDIPF